MTRPDPLEQGGIASAAVRLFAVSLPLAALVTLGWGIWLHRTWNRLTEGLEVTLGPLAGFAMSRLWLGLLTAVPVVGAIAVIAARRNRTRLIASFAVFHVWLLLFCGTAGFTLLSWYRTAKRVAPVE